MTDRGREREQRRKRRRESDIDDESGITGWKLGMVIGVIVVCFAMLYPTVLHSVLMGMLGRNDPPKTHNPTRPPVHPGMGGGNSRPGGFGGRHDVHPAMRMASAQAETQTGGRGMFTWMLPLYTVGVVVFLLYTLFKSKKKKKRSRYDSSEYSTEDEDENGDNFKRKLGKKKLRGLQERLRQTEDAMSKILTQLEAVQTSGLNLMGTTAQNTTCTLRSAGTNSEAKKTESIVMNPQSEQYINDIEKALSDFKVLSEAYEKEKNLHHHDSESEEDTNSDEVNSSFDDNDEESGEQITKEGQNIQNVTEEEKERDCLTDKTSISAEKVLKNEGEIDIDIVEKEENMTKDSVIKSKSQERKARRRALKT